MLPAIGQALSIGSQAGSLAPALGTTAAGAAGVGTGFLKTLLSSPKGIAALGQGVGALGQAAGLMIGGEKGKKVAQSAGMFGLIAGLAPDIAGAVQTFTKPNTGTEATGGTLKGLFEGYTPGSEKLINPGETNLGYMGILGNTFA